MRNPEPRYSTPESLNLDDAIHGIVVRAKLKGPAVPENPLARLIPEKPDGAIPPSRGAALAVMRAARLRAMRTLFSRQTHTKPAIVANAGSGRKGAAA